MENISAEYSPQSMVFDRIRTGIIDDETFDLIFPEPLRRVSSQHWTPIQLAKRAAELAVTEPGATVLDVGAGAGKFCIVGSFVTEGIFVGLEQRGHLVDAARCIVKRYGVQRVRFDQGNMIDYDWSQFDSIYLYNPFSENLDSSNRIDDSCELNAELYIRYIRTTQRKLAGLKSGTRIVTLNGFGGELPPFYKLLHREGGEQMPLELWIRD
jgi:hypothetical protein